ncbi:MAG: AAA family ATPase [Candidatus Krumholzibacteria bacterium]
MNQTNMNNPFVLGGVARGRHFAGRHRELARLRTLASEGQRLFLFAPRRYGKTSLLREALEPEAEAGRLMLMWCDCLATNDEHSLTRRIAEPVIRAARQKGVTQWAKAVARLFKRIRPTLAVGQDGEVRVSVDLAAPGAAGPDDIEDALRAAGHLAASRKQPAVFVFDEFQQIAAWDRDHRTEAAIRTVVQDQPGIAYVFAGSEQHLLEAMFTTRDRPLFKLAVPFPLGRLSGDELRPWLRARFGETGLALDPEALDALIRIGAGHPWATQYLAHFVWNDAATCEASHITSETIQAGLSAALKVGATIFDRDLASLTASQRRVLVAIAEEPTDSPTAVAYLREHRLPAKSTVSQSLRSLVQQGLVERKDGLYRLSDPLFGERVRRQ